MGVSGGGVLRTVWAVLAVLFAVPAAAQPIHGAPQGCLTYVPASVPKSMMAPGQCHSTLIEPQCHWARRDTPPAGVLLPFSRHTHLGSPEPRIGAEVSAGPITIPIFTKLFQTDGVLALLDSDFMTEYGPIPISEIVLDTFPVKGNPDANGQVVVAGHMTFDPAKAVVRVADQVTGAITDMLAIPKRGWFNIRLRSVTYYDDGATLTNESWFSYYSVLDPNAPEPPIAEGTQETASKCMVYSPFDERPGGNVFGIHLSEFRQFQDKDGSIVSGYPPIFARFSTPQTVRPFTYSYGFETTLPPALYELRLDSDLHHLVLGQLIATTGTEIPGGISNVDVLDPVVIAASKAPASVTPGKHRLSFNWIQNTGAGSPGLFPPNETLTSLLVMEVEIGDNPQPAPPVVIPPVVTPPVIVPPVVVPPVVIPVVPTIFEFTCDNNIPKKCALVIK